MTWFVLVPGACHGGWWFEPSAELLRRAGHTADDVTLQGLDPDAPPSCEAINLEMHVNQVVDLLKARDDSVGTLMQRSKLTGAYQGVNRKHYVLATATSWVPHSPFSTSPTTSWPKDPTKSCSRSWNLPDAGLPNRR